MEKGLKMTIQVSKDMLEKMIQGDKSHSDSIIFKEENDHCGTQKNDSE